MPERCVLNITARAASCACPSASTPARKSTFQPLVLKDQKVLCRRGDVHGRIGGERVARRRTGSLRANTVSAGYIDVPQVPGIGVELNMDGVRAHAVPGYGVFE